ncbi:MAG TPA: glycosyltransferase family 39 protein [bacterium]|nr:glycosyltransferase family 39 protein [bacterium]
MTESRPYKPHQLNPNQWFWFLAFMGLLTRLPFLKIFSAETTDGVYCLTYFSPDFVQTQTPRFIILPGYPALLWMGQHLGLPGWLWGRLVSSAAGLLFLVPLWKLARRWVPVEMSGVICLMALFSPLLWEWSLRVMPDTLFLMAFWWCLERLTTVYIDKSPAAWWQACLTGALAALTRPEGFLLLPWLLVSGVSLSREGVWKKLTGLAVVWAAPLYFISSKFLTLLYAYQEGMGLTDGAERVHFPFVNFIDHLYAYLSQPLYVFTPLVFWFAVLGMAKMARRGGGDGEAFRKILVQVYILIFISRLIPATYQDRHMLVFLPLLVLAAGYQLESFFDSLKQHQGTMRLVLWKNGLLTLCMAWMALFSATVLISENDSFGDIKRSSEFLETLSPDAVIYSDELPKTEFWSGRKVALMPYLYQNTQFNPKPGDIVVLHSFYIPRINEVDRHLVETHDAKTLREESSMVVPLLTDVMEDPNLQNRTASTAFRFKPQFFVSRVYQIRK